MPQLIIDYPNHFPDLLNQTPSEFEEDARLQLAIRLFEQGRLSSGHAAQLAGIERVNFLLNLSKSGVAMIDYDSAELLEELKNV